ncbi:AAA family ATPase [Myxococcus stipitatus]|uniref:ATP-binding protein n=1 Tax=Myxococcus stipitatus TaxID=83455 RepID=UPI001F363B0C|nr:ATP-binding protein [Myxococcus stipitatus]MCE9673657.1 AAA family ATPase [Myxococcus stipitatus]
MNSKFANLTLCYEGIQRIYRNAVLGHVRANLQLAFPADYVERAKRPFLKEWDTIKTAAEERRRTGELGTPLVDDLDILGVNHFFNLFETYADHLVPKTAGSGGDLKKTKKALLGWMQNIKALRDPLSHPAEADLSFEDAFVLLDCARRVLTQLGRPEAVRVHELASQLAGRTGIADTGDDRQPLEDRLPAREAIVVRFVGRTEELQQLHRWFDDPLSRRWAVVGAGGLGKSALAYAFAEEIRRNAPRPFQLVLWMSAKARRFEDGHVVSIENPDFFDLDSALSRLLSLLGWREEAASSLETKRALALELLDAFPALVVVDDIDSLEGAGEDAIEFFTLSVPQTKSKVLLTSRRTILGLGHTVTQVAGLSREDAEAFVRSRYELLGMDAKRLDASLLKQLVDSTGASPLYLEDLIRLVVVMPAKQAIQEWTARSGDEARRYALGRELDKLSSVARELLAAACVTQRAVSFGELQALTGQSHEALAAALGELQKLFLVPKPQFIDGEDRYDVGINTRALVQRVMGKTDLWRRIQGAHASLSGDVRIRQGREEVGALCRKAVLLVRGDDQEGAEALLKKGLEKRPNNVNLLAYLGFVYKTWRPPRRTDARERFQRAYELKCRDKEMYKHWVRMELDEDEWSGAFQAAEKGLECLPKNPLLQYYAGYAKSRLAKELAGGLHHEKAIEAVKAAQGYLDAALLNAIPVADHRKLRSDIYRALALNWERLGDKAKVFAVLDGWRQEDPDDPNLRSEEERLLARLGDRA